MGQRFQVAYITKTERGEIFKQDFHLQWCWGYYSIIRANQILEYFEDNLTDKFSPARLNWMKGELDDIFHCLLSVNNLFKSYVRVEKYSSEENQFIESPFDYDNNDGFLFIDLRNDKPKYCFGYTERGSDILEIFDASDYMKRYTYLIDEKDMSKMTNKEIVQRITDDKKIKKMVKYINSFQSMSPQEVCDMYEKLDINNIQIG